MLVMDCCCVPYHLYQDSVWCIISKLLLVREQADILVAEGVQVWVVGNDRLSPMERLFSNGHRPKAYM